MNWVEWEKADWQTSTSHVLRAGMKIPRIRIFKTLDSITPKMQNSKIVGYIHGMNNLNKLEMTRQTNCQQKQIPTLKSFALQNIAVNFGIIIPLHVDRVGAFFCLNTAYHPPFAIKIEFGGSPRHNDCRISQCAPQINTNVRSNPHTSPPTS